MFKKNLFLIFILFVSLLFYAKSPGLDKITGYDFLKWGMTIDEIIKILNNKKIEYIANESAPQVYDSLEFQQNNWKVMLNSNSESDDWNLNRITLYQKVESGFQKIYNSVYNEYVKKYGNPKSNIKDKYNQNELKWIGKYTIITILSNTELGTIYITFEENQ